ncbi:MAG: murein hydrolase activator EnvC family protein [Bacteroidota bacterium]
MPAGNVHHKKQLKSYSVVLFPKGETGKTRSFTLSPLSIALTIVAVVALVSGSILALLIYTPVGGYVPISNPELENRYGKQIVALQQRVNMLAEDMFTLREYNLTLRKALGEELSDTAAARAKRPVDYAASIVSEPNPLIFSELVGEELQWIDPTESSAEGKPFRLASRTPDESSLLYLPISFPVMGYITRGFDASGRHFGIDIAGKKGSPVSAVAGGNIIFSGWTYDDGQMVIISHAGGYLTFYKHNQMLLESVGSRVKRGEPIALLGNSGKASLGPHLHFEVWKNSIPIDPSEFLLLSYGY